ncbi:MAG: polyprenyl synthetase family protein, partial [Planctomycetota bacterium]
HVERYRGKMLRPTMVLLCGLASNPESAEAFAAGKGEPLLTGEHIGLGAVVEMVHMATLVHDDVLDEAEVRRRGETVNKMTNNETAVILGDYLIAAAYHLCSTVASKESTVAVGDTAMELTAGELLQLAHRRDWSLDDATYFEIVQRKTGALIGLACALGAAASDAPREVQDAVRRFGEKSGIAFQIQDDLLDLTGEEGTVGKSVRRDLVKGKLTLPLIHGLAVATPTDRGALLELIESAADEPDGADDLADRIAALLQKTDSIEYARSVAESLVDEGRTALDLLPEGPAKDLLKVSADAVVKRKF